MVSMDDSSVRQVLRCVKKRWYSVSVSASVSVFDRLQKFFCNHFRRIIEMSMVGRKTSVTMQSDFPPFRMVTEGFL